MAIVVLALTACVSSSQAEVSGLEEGYIEINGTRLFYKTMGSGEAIVFLHGGPGFDHRQFLPNVWELASNHKVILFDQRGTGLSSGPVDSESITMENFIQDIEGIRTEFGLEKMNLFGHSWGGMLAMHYALRYPENLKSLILASTAASFSSFGDMRKAIVEARSPADSAALRKIADSEAFQQRDAETVERFWRIYFKVYFADPALVSELDLAFTENTLRYSDAVASLILQSAGEFDLRGALTTLTVPTLILHGDSDPMPLAYAEQIHLSIPDSRLVVLERSGHWVFVDAIDQITAAVEEFLSDLT